jgi:Fe-Mn family superoxide dismutase
VNKLNEIWEKLPNADRSKANQNYSEFRELKLEETFNFDGSLLHETYFANLAKEHAPVSESFKKQVEKDFGSYEKWVEDFKATGVAFRGWSLCVFDLNTGKLRNVGADVHNTNGIWNAILVLALDVYEHAYYTDYGPKRAPYLDAFLKNVKWSDVEQRLEKAKKMYEIFK